MTDPIPVPILAVNAVSRSLAGREIVRDLSLSLRRGEVLGLLGINGAGKSTTLRMIAGVLAPDRGQVLIDGADLYETPELARRGIGYLPEQAPLHRELTVEEFLRFCARLRGLKGAAVGAALDQAIARCDLAEVRRRLIGQLSKGFQQRVGIAQALIHRPPLVILDEPASGLDPVQSVRMRELVASLRPDHAVILSTHLLAEAQVCCDRIAILHRGQLRHQAATSAERTEQLEQQFLRIATDLEPVAGVGV
ncbi:ABC transporter ATP-binding protein [Tahibacter amnicola]|uniref:ABC transporter ATP-binding protein n=1 Tax=Tahibacter amnicola TaxID=2976241 RepID=A0ABY6BEX3_9GAMM|nr:ABC transporter ATP-binding protein [Tahibacter amnicola]UXI68583.1 ABC transporter ATP-binding protein [Tahibacter amnicola]